MSTLTYLSLDELETVAAQNPGFQILSALGPNGRPEWHLQVPIAGKQVTFRAHRPIAEVAS